MKISSIYNHHSVEGITFEGDSITQQHFKDETNINFMMRRYAQTGVLPQVDGAMYGDFPDDFDFHTAQNLLLEASARFDSLPAETRKRFDNDPGALLSFLSDQENYEEAVRLGLVEKRPEPSSVDMPPTVEAGVIPQVVDG